MSYGEALETFVLPAGYFKKSSLHDLFFCPAIRTSSTSSAPHLAMSFRLPTNPDAFVPPPSEQLTLARPWRGSFVYPQAQPSRNATLQEIFVTAAETEGDKCVSSSKSSSGPQLLLIV